MCPRFLSLVFVAACGRIDTMPASAATSSAAPATPAPAPAPAPTPGNIQQIAVIEDGDAALTLDSLGALRLWPSLDGKRAPIPVAATAVSSIALVSTGDVLAAAIVDTAGGLRIARFTRDGALLSSLQISGEVEVMQVAALDREFVVLRRDQTIERLDSDGTLRGRLGAEPGEHIEQLASRHGAALALLAEQGETASTARWITLGRDLAWGERIKLPGAIIPGTLALSPGKTKIAGVGTALATLFVFDLPRLAIVPGPEPIQSIAPGATVGFATDDLVLVTTTGMTKLWSAAAHHDPWAHEPPIDPASGGAVADGLLVTGWGSSLAISNGAHTQYLGWSHLAAGNVQMTGNRIVLAPDHMHQLWLDERLDLVRDVDLGKLGMPDALYAIPVGDHDVIRVNQGERNEVVLAELDPPNRQLKIGSVVGLSHIEFDEASHTLAFQDSKQTDTERWQIDLATTTAKRLAPLHHGKQVNAVKLTDPARAEGITAIVIENTSDGPRQTWYREDQNSKQQMLGEPVISYDALGRVITRGDDGLVLRRDAKIIGHVPVTGAVQFVTPSNDGTRFAVIVDQVLEMIDAHGTVLWKRAVWGGGGMFTPDDRRIVVKTSGGVVSVDAATGDVIARECGWGFGLHDVPPPVTALGETTACETDR